MDIKEHFPFLKKGVVYFDSAATSQKPRAVIEAISTFYAEEYGTVHRAIYSLAAHATERYNAVRAQVARFLNAASPSEIIFTRGTTDSINLVAASFGRSQIERGDEILISEMEHHSNIVPKRQKNRHRAPANRWRGGRRSALHR
jgi:cysteine desulfurase/selenocysteine lyase